MTKKSQLWVVGTLVILSLVIMPLVTTAQGVTADAQCVPPGPPSKGGKDGLPCKLNVSQGTQMGICKSAKCIGTSYSGGGQDGGAVDQGLKMLGDIVGKLMEKLAGGQSGGGSQAATTPADCSASTTQDWKLGRCKEIGVASDIFDSTKNVTAGTSGGSSVTTSLLESFADSGPSDLPVTNVTPLQQQNQSPESALTSVAQNGFVSAPDPGATAPDSTANAQGERTIFAPVNLGNPNVQETDDGVSVTSGGVDTQTNTGISSFFGLFRPQSAPAESSTMFGRLCSAKPWESSLITRIFTARFFDSLCEQRLQGAQNNSTVQGTVTNAQSSIILRCPSVVQPGGEATIEWSCGANIRSSGTGFNTNGASSGKVSGRPTTTRQYTLQCAQGGSRSCVIEVANPRVDLVAYPERVQLGARAKLYWVSEGVEDCIVTGPGLSEQGSKGAAVTGAILDTTTFTAECLGANGATTTDSVIVDVGA